MNAIKNVLHKFVKALNDIGSDIDAYFVIQKVMRNRRKGRGIYSR